MTVYNIYTRAIITSNYLITRRAHSAHLDGAVRVNLGCDAPGAGAEGDLGRGACKTDSQSSKVFIRTNDGRCLEPLWTPLTADNIPAWQVRGSNWSPALQALTEAVAPRAPAAAAHVAAPGLHRVEGDGSERSGWGGRVYLVPGSTMRQTEAVVVNIIKDRWR